MQGCLNVRLINDDKYMALKARKRKRCEKIKCKYSIANHSWRGHKGIGQLSTNIEKKDQKNHVSVISSTHCKLDSVKDFHRFGPTILLSLIMNRG